MLCFHGKYLNTIMSCLRGLMVTLVLVRKAYDSKESAVRACAGEEGSLPLRSQLYVHVLVRKAYCLLGVSCTCICMVPYICQPNVELCEVRRPLEATLYACV